MRATPPQDSRELPPQGVILQPEKRRLADDGSYEISRDRKPPPPSYSHTCLQCAEPRRAIRSFFEHRRRKLSLGNENTHLRLQAQSAFIQDSPIALGGSGPRIDPVSLLYPRFDPATDTWILLDNVRGFRQHRETDCTFCQILLNSVLREDENSALFKFWKNREEALELRVGMFSTMFGLENSGKVKENSNESFGILLGTERVFRQDKEKLSESVQANGIAAFREHQDAAGLFAGQVLTEYFNAAAIQEAVEYCQRRHKLCISLAPRIENLELIDCKTRRICPAPKDSVYIALSYVWGSSLGQEAYNIEHADGHKLLPVTLPRVISDAMSVTQVLGYQYLWVDKFCIDQNDAEKFHGQIRQMDAIYERAELTIIAAAGDNEDSPLPGSTSARNNRQLVADLEGMSVVWVKDPQHDIRSSKWATRGWTYQEAVLSRRRLAFTTDQVYFECNAMNFFENIYTPPSELHNRTKTKMHDDFRAGMFGRKRKFGKWNPDTMSAHDLFMQYCSCVEEYSSRTLRYDSDALNAFNGIVRKFSKNKIPMIDVLGLAYPLAGKRPAQLNSFAYSMLWLSIEGSSPRRRPEFPSWTWAGWNTTVEYPRDVGSETVQFSNALLSISFEYYPSGEVVKLGEQHDRQDVPQILQVRAYTVPSYAFTSFQSADESSDAASGLWRISDFNARLLLCQTAISPVQIIKELNQGHHYKGIYIGSDKSPAKVFIMILENQKSSVWSRAGIFIVDCEATEFHSMLGRRGGHQWTANADRATFRVQ